MRRDAERSPLPVGGERELVSTRDRSTYTLRAKYQLVTSVYLMLRELWFDVERRCF